MYNMFRYKASVVCSHTVMPKPWSDTEAGRGVQVESHREGRAGWAALAWNCKLNYILATASIDGAFSVWDLRKQKPTVDRLHDSAG